MNYQKIEITLHREHVESALSLLDDLGITGVEIDDPAAIQEIVSDKAAVLWDFVDEKLLTTPVSDTVTVIFYLDEDHTMLLPDVLEGLVGQGLLTLENVTDIAKYVTVSEVADTDWQDNYKLHFRTTPISDHLVIVPSWESDTFDGAKWDERMPIFLDPGMAFGTGEHATTSMCAKLMDEYGCEGKTVLDVGTGSGILAIGAALLGATEVLGVDIDPDAVAIAKENVEKNHVGDKVAISYGDLTKGLTIKADMVLGNLVSGIVKDLAKDVTKHLREGGIFISSGILQEQKEDVKAALIDAGLTYEKTLTEGEWCAIACRYA